VPGGIVVQHDLTGLVELGSFPQEQDGIRKITSTHVTFDTEGGCEFTGDGQLFWDDHDPRMGCRLATYKGIDIEK
jgi:hypothetical protein